VGGGEGVFILLHSKLVVTGLSFEDSKEFFGDSGQNLWRIWRCAETLHMSGLRAHSVGTPMPGDFEKTFENSGLLCRVHSKDIPSVV
jgi:hypothetical protein